MRIRPQISSGGVAGEILRSMEKEAFRQVVKFTFGVHFYQVMSVASTMLLGALSYFPHTTTNKCESGVACLSACISVPTGLPIGNAIRRYCADIPVCFFAGGL